MTREAYATVFVRAGWFGLVFAVSVQLITQGNVLVVSVPGLDNRIPNLSAFFAIPIIGITLAIMTTAGALHAALPRRPGEAASPIAGLGDAAGTIDARRRSARLYISAMLVLFIAPPVWSLGHLSRVVMDRAGIWNEVQSPPVVVPPACFMPFPLSRRCDADGAQVAAIRADGIQRLSLADNRCDPHHIRLPGGAPPTCEPSAICADRRERCRGVDWLPVWSPLAIIVPTVAGWGGSLWFLFALAAAPGPIGTGAPRSKTA